MNPESHLFVDVEESLLFATISHGNMFLHSEVTMVRT